MGPLAHGDLDLVMQERGQFVLEGFSPLSGAAVPTERPDKYVDVAVRASVSSCRRPEQGRIREAAAAADAFHRPALLHHLPTHGQVTTSSHHDEMFAQVSPALVGPVSRENGTRAGYVRHMLDEFIHHGAEVALLRDLYRWQRPISTDALTARAIRAAQSLLVLVDIESLDLEVASALLSTAASFGWWALVEVIDRRVRRAVARTDTGSRCRRRRGARRPSQARRSRR